MVGPQVSHAAEIIIMMMIPSAELSLCRNSLVLPYTVLEGPVIRWEAAKRQRDLPELVDCRQWAQR